MSNKNLAFTATMAAIMSSEPIEFHPRGYSVGKSRIFDEVKKSHTLSNSEYKRRRKAEMKHFR